MGWVLIIVLGGYGYQQVDTIYFGSLVLCESAKKRVASMTGRGEYRRLNAECVETGAKK